MLAQLPNLLDTLRSSLPARTELALENLDLRYIPWGRRCYESDPWPNG